MFDGQPVERYTEGVETTLLDRSRREFMMEVLEGTWEEILEHGKELAGRRVKVIVEDTPEQKLDPRWEQFIGAVEAPAPTCARDSEKEIGRILQEKRSRRKL